MYVVASKPKFSPSLDRDLKRIAKEIRTNFPAITFCVWSTTWLLDLMEMLPAHRWDLIEVERDAIEPVFRFLQSVSNIPSPFLQPSSREMELYVSVKDHSLIVRPLMSQAPTRSLEKISVPTLEKILVDLVADSLFEPFSGSSGRSIWSRAFDVYAINLSMLWRYTERRRKEHEVVTLLNRIEVPNYVKRWIDEVLR